MLRQTPLILLLATLACGDDGAGGAGGASDASGLPGGDGGGPVTCQHQAGSREVVLDSGTAAGRRFTVVVPAGLTVGSPVAAIVNFHGNTSTATEQQLFSQMNGTAEALGFIAVYPQGVGNSWNAGVCCGQAQSENVDEIDFAQRIVDHLVQSECVAPDRVYATGLSNGGFLAHRIACERPELFAAYSSVAGLVGVPSCTPSERRPVLQFHGDADSIVPYDGNSALGFPPVEETMDAWADRNGCDATRTVSFEMGDVRCERYEGCDPAAPVELCRVLGGGHTWPSGMVPSVLGATTTDIDANLYMMQFFEP